LGNTTIDFAVQLRLASFPSFGPNAVADSVKFFSITTLVYGDTTTVQKLRFYELNLPIDPDANYYGTDDLSQHASSVQLAEYILNPGFNSIPFTRTLFISSLVSNSTIRLRRN
jgi:hypothetical protein